MMFKDKSCFIIEPGLKVVIFYGINVTTNKLLSVKMVELLELKTLNFMSIMDSRSARVKISPLELQILAYLKFPEKTNEISTKRR